MNPSVVISILGAIGSIIIALGTWYKFRKSAQISTQKNADTRMETVARVTADELKRLTEEVKTLRSEVESLRAQVGEFQDQARRSRETIESLTNELKDIHRLLTTVRAIFAGYVERVKTAWGRDSDPPVPSAVDKAILEDTLSPDQLALALAKAGLA